MNPDLAQLARTVEELSRRVERLEAMIAQRAVRSDRPYIVPTSPRASLESRVGSQYLNRAGVIALLVGIAFFLNWAFVNHWIGPAAIVAVGFIAGIGLFALGEWFRRRRYGIFGLSLEGLGIAAVYLTLWAASEYYGILLPWAAFGGMVLLTTATAFVAVIRNSEALAIFAAIGGFGTPLLLSTGRNLESELFAYVLVLCAGMVLTVRFRPWLGLMATSFAGALAVSVVWFVNYYRKPEQIETAIFFVLLLAAFTVAPILVHRRFARPRDPLLLLISPASMLMFLLGAGTILDSETFLWVVQIAAVAFLVASWRFARGELQVSLFVTAIAASAASIPVALDAHWTTSAIWLSGGVALVIVGFLKKLPFVRWGALGLIVVTVLKVFIYDLSNLGQGYRILALSILGVALLSLSFLYQRDWLGMRKQ